MRGLILAVVASFAVVAFAPSGQASPLIPASGMAGAAAQSDVVQAHWYGHHRHWHRGWHRGMAPPLRLAPSPVLVSERSPTQNTKARLAAGL